VRSSDDTVWEDLVIAILAVGGFTVKKVLAGREALDRSNLFDPQYLADCDEARLTRELYAAGYTRGMLTGMYADRLSAVMRALASSGRLQESQAILASERDDLVADLLLPLHGVGPKVLNNFLALRRLRRKDVQLDQRTNER
jgi:3-methyladenine DNA glycosylase/8-oxoguanine DNA glycosylase